MSSGLFRSVIFCELRNFRKFEVLRLVNFKIMVLLDVMPPSLVDRVHQDVVSAKQNSIISEKTVILTLCMVHCLLI